MCGFFGAAFLPPHAKASVGLAGAIEAIRHRGPDAQASLEDEDLIFGHARLRILDLTEAGKQPMQSADGKVILIFNGEIYNYVELRETLLKKGCSFKSQSDTEVLLEGYRVFGESIVDHIHGMFAFGIFDKSTRTLLLARDRAGKKPLFYTGNAEEGFRFASTAAALIASGTPRAFDVTSLPSLLAFGSPRAPRSMYQGISQLPPASTLVIREGKPPVLRRYWTPPFGMPSLKITEDEAVREFKRLFEAALRRRLRSDVPVGAFLSGGLDSSVVVAVMASMTKTPVKTFTLGFSHDPKFDETHYARMVANRFGTDHTEFQLTPTSFDVIERLVWMHDGPFADSSAIPTAFVSGLTRKHAVVALSGDGGDEILAGYTRFLAIEASERIPKTALRVLQQALRFMPAHPKVTRGKHFVSRALLPLPEQILAWQSYFGLKLHEVIRPEIAHELPLYEPIHQSQRILEEMPNGSQASALSKILYYNFQTYLPDDLLLKADRASMNHALELRSPFLDTELIEFAARLPDHLLRRGRTTKWILRKAYGDLLPPELLTRKKMGFGIPLGAWFRTDLRDYIHDQLADGSPIYKYIRRDFVQKLLREHFSQNIDHGMVLWAMLTFAIWLRSLERPFAQVQAL
jgi:asparagine synthase (glutamine-hydrolysing)